MFPVSIDIASRPVHSGNFDVVNQYWQYVFSFGEKRSLLRLAKFVFGPRSTCVGLGHENDAVSRLVSIDRLQMLKKIFAPEIVYEKFVVEYTNLTVDEKSRDFVDELSVLAGK